MKQLLTIAAVIASVAGTVFAGPAPSFKKMAVEPRPEIYGLGWYGALQAGVNAYVDAEGLDLSPTGFVSDIDTDVGGVGGGKFGYVFNTGKWRPAVEADLFYNGFGWSNQINTPAGAPFGATAGSVNSFAYLANLLLRYDLGRFQPYIGGGIGGYWASIDIDAFSNNVAAFATSRDNASWAWQVIGGADYYFTERVSGFAEYKFLNYEDFKEWDGNAGLGIGSTTTTLQNHIFALGVRIHF
jgi:opacity protein-like surface antigen